MQSEKHKAQNKYKPFLNYLIPNILIMLIPTLIFTVFINFSLLSRLREQYIEDTVKSLNQVMDTTDRNISQLEMIRDHILSQPEIIPSLNLKEVVTSRKIIDEFKKYAISNGFIKDIVLYLEGDSYIYTSRSTYLIDTFFTGKQCYQDWSTEEFLDMTKNLFSPEVRPVETVAINGISYEVLSVIYPISLNNVKAYLLFLVDTTYLDIEEPTSSFFIIDSKGELLNSVISPEIPMDKFYIDDSSGEIQLTNNKQYLSSSISSSQTGWSYYKITTAEIVYGDFLKIQHTFYGIILAIIVISIILIYVNMAVTYNPLIKLKRFAENISENNQSSKDTIGSIEAALKHLVNQNIELKGKDATIVKSHFLLQLFKGRINSEEEFKKQLTELKLDRLKGPFYFIFILSLKNREGKKSTYKIEASVLETLINQLFPGYIREHSESGKFVFIGSLESDDSLPFSHSSLDVQSLLQKELEVDVALACSSIGSSFYEIPQCYMEASIAIDYCFIKGNNCVIDSTQLVLNEEIGAIYPQKLFDRLDYQIKNGDVDKIEEVLDELIDYMKTSHLPLYYIKGLCYQLINNISSMIEYLNYDMSIKNNKLSYATVLADFDTADELMEAVRNISINICSFIRDEKTQIQDNQITEIKDYIFINYKDSNFSVQNMAEHFKMSLPMISSFFKNECSITIIDYVTELRMNYAKELLLEDKYTLNEIVTMVGYLNTSSFIRKFKAIHGLTPGQYVKHNKEKSK